MGLRETLDNMLREAKRTGQPARRRLAKGLMLAVKLNGERVNVQLSRADVFPSTHEWKTIIQQWPGLVTVSKAPKSIKGDLYYLKGQVIPSQELVKELE
jgi:hypothetical protein